MTFYLLEHSAVEEGILGGSHDEVVRVVLVVDDVLELDAVRALQPLEELRVVLLLHAADLVDVGLLLARVVDEVASDGDGELGVHLVPVEPVEVHRLAAGAHNHVEGEVSKINK